MNALQIPCEVGEVSDGFHTFNELYEHRIMLFIALMSVNPEVSWISTKHHDGEEWEGWFVAGMKLPTGDITYHLPISRWGIACDAGIPVRDYGKEWDGHTSEDVISRLEKWILDTSTKRQSLSAKTK